MSHEIKTQVIVPLEADSQKRLDRFLCEAFPSQTRSQVQKWIDQSLVLVNSQPAKAGLRLRGLERIEVRFPEVAPSHAFAEDIPLDVVYEDSDLAVINKPSGMVVHIGAGVHQGTLVNALLHHFRQLSTSGGSERPGIVHRLDKQTSGLLLIAKNDLSHVQLSRQFQSRAVTKRYMALVHGELPGDQGEIRASIGRDRVNRVKMSTRGTHSREAFTQYEVVERFAHFTLVRLTIRTGRTHQIRVHMSSLHHPVVGDTLYGAPGRVTVPGKKQTHPTLNRNFLHSTQLDFNHPRTGQSLRFSSELPPDLTHFLSQLRHHDSG